jgi:hypothetical protein
MTTTIINKPIPQDPFWQQHHMKTSTTSLMVALGDKIRGKKKLIDPLLANNEKHLLHQ